MNKQTEEFIIYCLTFICRFFIGAAIGLAVCFAVMPRRWLGRVAEGDYSIPLAVMLFFGAASVLFGGALQRRFF